MIRNCLQNLWTTERITFNPLGIFVCFYAASSHLIVFHRSFPGNWCLEFCVMNFLPQILNYSVTEKFAGLISNMNFYDPHRWHIPIAGFHIPVLRSNYYLKRHSNFIRIRLFFGNLSLFLWFFLNVWKPMY